MNADMDTRKETRIVLGVLLVVVVVGVIVFLPNMRTEQPVVVSQSAAVIVPFETLARGKKSTVTSRVNYVITSSAELAKLWKMVDAKDPPPTVDFSTQTVLAVFAGKGAGADIMVTGVTDAAKRVISVAIAPAAPTCVQKVATIAPYEIVAVPTTSLSLTHRDTTAAPSCP